MLANKITLAILQRAQAGAGANLGNATLIRLRTLSSNVGSCKFLSNNLISVIKETF